MPPNPRTQRARPNALAMLLLGTLAACGATESAGTSRPQPAAAQGAADAEGGGTGEPPVAPVAVDPEQRCADPSLSWKTGRKTNYTSYPDPDSEECVVYNGCIWAGQFAHCAGVLPESWVASHDIAAVFPDSGLEGHDLCIRSGDRVMIVTAIDTCGDSDCDGCCTKNRGDADALIDLESYTNDRWGLADSAVSWADLGPNADACTQ